jgi:hypothetical protein
MEHGIFSQTSMVITHLVVDDYLLVQLATPCSNIVDLAQIEKYSAVFAAIYANAPQL